MANGLSIHTHVHLLRVPYRYIFYLVVVVVVVRPQTDTGMDLKIPKYSHAMHRQCPGRFSMRTSHYSGQNPMGSLESGVSAVMMESALFSSPRRGLENPTSDAGDHNVVGQVLASANWQCQLGKGALESVDPPKVAE